MRPTSTATGIGILLVLAASAFAESPERGLKITVHVYNYAGISSETLAKAEQEAARIYEKLGLETQWLDCPLAPEQAADFPACNQPMGPAGFALRVISRDMASRMKLSKTTFGHALLPEDGGFGYSASVCAHRAEELSEKTQASTGVILGHLIAHEIGHLLLGIGSHDTTGIMHVPWYPKELAQIEQGSMFFNKRQAKRVRNQLAKRFELARVD